VGFRMGTFFLVMDSSSNRLVVDHFQSPAFDQLLQRLVIDIGVGDLTALVGAEVQYLAPGKGHAKRSMGFVADRLHGESS